MEEIISSLGSFVIYFVYKKKSESIRVFIGFSKEFLGDNLISDSRVNKITIEKKRN